MFGVTTKLDYFLGSYLCFYCFFFYLFEVKIHNGIFFFWGGGGGGGGGEVYT